MMGGGEKGRTGERENGRMVALPSGGAVPGGTISDAQPLPGRPA